MHTDFDFCLSLVVGPSNQKGTAYERNILMVILVKTGKRQLSLGDHYDTAYMEDIYEKDKRGNRSTRQAANGADDNYSASGHSSTGSTYLPETLKGGKLKGISG